MYPGQIILLSARVREGHILKAKFRLGGKAGARGQLPPPAPPAGAAHVTYVYVQMLYRQVSAVGNWPTRRNSAVDGA